MPFWFRTPPEGASVESLVLRADDGRQVRALHWTNPRRPIRAAAVVIMHPRVDFHHHYAIPRLLAAGFRSLQAIRGTSETTRSASTKSWSSISARSSGSLRERVAKVVLLGGCGGASLAAYYQAEARAEPTARTKRSPGGARTGFDKFRLPFADLLCLVAAHRGQGQIMLDAIDPSVTDETDPSSLDGSLDLYDEKNGFAEPPHWSSYTEAFLTRYREAQRERVARIDAIARRSLAARSAAIAEMRAPGFDRFPFSTRQKIEMRVAHEPVLVVHRTMANPRHVSQSIDPSPRDYGSLLSERPDLMNRAAFGLARTVTPRAWLSTWSGLSSNADVVKNVARIADPTLVVHAERDREVYLDLDAKPIFAASVASDKRLEIIEGARHYFEPEPGAMEAPHVERLMDVVIPWIEERIG